MADFARGALVNWCTHCEHTLEIFKFISPSPLRERLRGLLKPRLHFGAPRVQNLIVLIVLGVGARLPAEYLSYKMHTSKLLSFFSPPPVRKCLRGLLKRSLHSEYPGAKPSWFGHTQVGTWAPPECIPYYKQHTAERFRLNTPLKAFELVLTVPLW